MNRWKIMGSVVPNLFLMLACGALSLQAAENRPLTPEEFREQVRQFNETGKLPGRPGSRPVATPIPKGAAQYERAVTLHTKKGATPAELKEAASLYQVASDAGIPQASSNLAILYLEGKGVKKDVKKALALLNKGSRGNIPQADLALARLYLVGKDVKKDEKKGEWHLNKAAKTGDPNAKKMLAEYREWKKQNAQALKEYQELLKKARVSQPRQLPTQTVATTGSVSPFPSPAAPPPFPAIAGEGYLGTDRTPPPVPLSVTPAPSSFPQPGGNATAPSGR